MNFRRGRWKNDFVRGAYAAVAHADRGGDPFEELPEGCPVGCIEIDNFVGQQFDVFRARIGAYETDYDAAEMFLPDNGDSLLKQLGVGGSAVAHHKEQRHPVAFAFGCAENNFAVNLFAHKFEGFAQMRARSFGLRNVGYLHAFEFGKRQQLFGIAVKSYHAQMHRFEGERVLSQRGNQTFQAYFYCFYRFAAHCSGGLYQYINR